MNTITLEQEGKGFYLAQTKNSDLAIYSYYLESDKQAWIIDPLYDIKIFEEIIQKRGSKLNSILMTHYHADFISGHLEFKTPLFMGPQSKNKLNKFEINQLKENESYPFGSVTICPIHTPGHTLESTTYLLKDSQDNNVCIFTGDTLFLGDVGRPDLSTDEGLTKEKLAAMMFDSLQKLKKLQDNVRIYPAHGSGSACAGNKIDEGHFCTIGVQKQKNQCLKIKNKNQLISKLLSDLDEPPKYYSHDSKINKIGPNQHLVEFKKANNALKIQQFQELQKLSKIFDTRASIQDGGLIKGSFWTHNKGTITSWITMAAKPEDQILIVTQQGKGEQTLERFLRIGYFNVKGYNNFKVSQYPGQKQHLQVLTGKQVLQNKERIHLDIRNKDQWKKTGIFEGATLIPLKKLQGRINQLKDTKNIVINCKTGMRARFAESILARNGIQSVVLGEKIEQVEKIGFKLVPYIEQNKE